MNNLEEQLIKAISDNELEIAQKLINAGAKTNIKTHHGCYPQHLVKTPEAIKLLLAAGADMNAEDKYMETPLHYIAKSYYMTDDKKTEMIKIIINANVNINAKNWDNKTPFDLAENPQIAGILKAAMEKTTLCPCEDLSPEEKFARIASRQHTTAPLTENTPILSNTPATPKKEKAQER